MVVYHVTMVTRQIVIHHIDKHIIFVDYNGVLVSVEIRVPCQYPINKVIT